MNDLLNRVFFDNQVSDYLWFLGAVAVILLISKPLSKVLGYLIYRIFRKLTAESFAKQFLDLLQKPFSRFLVLFAVFLSFNFLTFPSVLDFSIYGLRFLLVLQKLYQLLMAVSILIILIRLVDYIVLVWKKKAEETASQADDQIVLFVRDILKVIIIGGGIVFILGAVFNLNISSLLAGAGIAGLAIAFAAKESIENLIGSFTIFFDKPFTVGDFIQVGQITGTVEKVGFRSTRIRTVNQSFVTLPNRNIIDAYSENLTLRNWRRVRNVVGLTYSTSRAQIEGVVKDIQDYIDAHELTNQNGIVAFHEFGDSSLNVLVVYFVQNLDYNVYIKVREEINFKIMEIVAQHNSDFAFPTRSVYMEKGNT